jgi:hypothetical protein
VSEIFPEHTPSPFGPDGPPSAMVEEARRVRALELATHLVAARERSGRTVLGNQSVAGDVVEVAERFANYLRGGS